MGDIVVSYETLFEMFRREKSRGELQELDKNFYENIVDYLKQKQEILEKTDDSVFAEEEKIRTEKQVYNIRKLLRDLYERREKKIFEMALSKSRNPKMLIDESALLQQEKDVYIELIAKLQEGREVILNNLLQMKIPTKEAVQKDESCEAPLISDEISLRFVEDTPEFVDTNMELVGPFKQGDEGLFSKEIAEILLDKGCAEVLKE